MGRHMLVELVRFINEQHGTAFAPLGRYPAGEQGAFAVAEGGDDHAPRFVLKWARGAGSTDDLRNAAALTDRLRAVGYPTPRYRLVGVAPPLGVVYSVQEALPGTPLGGRLDGPLLDRLLELNALQRGMAGTAAGDWPRAAVDPVLHGGDGFCLLDPLRTHSAATAALLGTLQRLVAAGADARAPTDDVVHFDFQGANILADRGRVSGVVDWEGCRAGDRAFDLATLFFYADEDSGADPGQRDRLWRLLLARAGPRLLGVYLAHLVLRQVDWSIRFHDPATVERWLGRADEVLRRLSATTEDGHTIPPTASSTGETQRQTTSKPTRGQRKRGPVAGRERGPGASETAERCPKSRSRLPSLPPNRRLARGTTQRGYPRASAALLRGRAPVRGATAGPS